MQLNKVACLLSVWIPKPAGVKRKRAAVSTRSEIEFTSADASLRLPDKLRATQGHRVSVASPRFGSARVSSIRNALILAVDRGLAGAMVVSIDVDRDRFLVARIDHLVDVRTGRHHCRDKAGQAVVLGGPDRAAGIDRVEPHFAKGACEDGKAA